jgi:hypothetical protein
MAWAAKGELMNSDITPLNESHFSKTSALSQLSPSYSMTPRDPFENVTECKI